MVKRPGRKSICSAQNAGEKRAIVELVRRGSSVLCMWRRQVNAAKDVDQALRTIATRKRISEPRGCLCLGEKFKALP